MVGKEQGGQRHSVIDADGEAAWRRGERHKAGWRAVPAATEALGAKRCWMAALASAVRSSADGLGE